MSLNIPIILGTARQGRESEKVAHALLPILLARGIDTHIIDVRNLDMPPDQDGRDMAARNPLFQGAIKAADGFIVVSPEYNHSIPGSLKRAMDMLFDEWNKKAVAFVGVSNGAFGGVRAAESFLPIARGLYLVSLRNDLYVQNVENFSSETSLPGTPFYTQADKLLTELIWMAEALQAKRNSSL